MCAAAYRSREEEVDGERSPLLSRAAERTVNGQWGGKEPDAAGEYLEQALGYILGAVLAECALNRPDDPVTFVANAFEK